MSAVEAAGTEAVSALNGFAGAVRGIDSPAGLNDLGLALADIAEAVEYAARACAEFVGSCPNLSGRLKRDMEDAVAYAGVLAGHCDSRLNFPLVMGRGAPGRSPRGWLGRRRYDQRDH